MWLPMFRGILHNTANKPQQFICIINDAKTKKWMEWFYKQLSLNIFGLLLYKATDLCYSVHFQPSFFFFFFVLLLIPFEKHCQLMSIKPSLWLCFKYRTPSLPYASVLLSNVQFSFIFFFFSPEYMDLPVLISTRKF